MNRRNLLLAAAGTLAAPAVLTRPALAQFGGGDSLKLRALEGGGFALQSSQIALQRSRSPRVRQFAELESNEQIAYANSVGAQPGSVPPRPDHAQMLQELSSLSGPRFDAMYIRGQIMGHQELLQLNTAIAQGGGNAIDRAVANVAVPSIQTHLVILSALRRG